MLENTFYLSQRLGFELRARGLKLALAESCTAGGLAEEITAVPGSSAWFDCGFVTYSDSSKINILGVKQITIDTYGAVSNETAREMAIGALNHSRADISLSITGIAGPAGGTREKPVGLVWFGLADRKDNCESRQALFYGGRKYIRHSAISFALKWLLEVSWD